MSANVIKANAISASSYGTIVRRETHEAMLKAEQILSDARVKAEEIMEQAARDREAVFEDAVQRGYSKGHGEWNEILVKAWKSHDDLVARSEQELVHLAVQIAERIVAEELTTRPDRILSIVNEAVKAARAEKKLSIRVAPQHEDSVRAHVESLRPLLGDVRQIVVVSDPSIEPTGCVVESDIGIIDAQLESQLKHLEEALLQKAN
jgi:type III secretion system HrpE/YscL family protein